MFTHVLSHFSDWHMRSKGARTGTHCLLDRHSCIEIFRPYNPENDAFVIHNDANIETVRAQPLANHIQIIIESAGRHVCPCGVAGAWFICLCSLRCEARCKPVELPFCVVEYPFEPETFQPMSGSRTEVTRAVPAIDD